MTEASGRPPAESRGLIEGARVPELEILALQQQLNARTRAGQLSGPLLPENGKLDMATEAKHRELSAWEAIGMMAIGPRPADEAAWPEAKEADKALLRQAREELEHIPDTSHQGLDHRGPTVAKIMALAEAIKKKWDVNPAIAQVVTALGPAIAPGSLLKADHGFDYGRMEHQMRVLQAAESLQARVPQADPAAAEIKALIDAHRAGFLAGLVPGAATPRAAAPPPTQTAPLPIDTGLLPEPGVPAEPDRVALPARRATTKELAAQKDPAREKQNRELDMMGPERRLGLLRSAEAAIAAGQPPDPLAARIVASLVRTHPEALLATHAALMDEEALGELGARLDEAMVAKIGPKVRLGLAKSLASRAGGDAAGRTAGLLAASLVRQHPQVLGELLNNAEGGLKAPMLLNMAGALGDDELARLPKEGLMALSKSLSGSIKGGSTMPGMPSSSQEERRQVSRLMRLATTRR